MGQKINPTLYRLGSDNILSSSWSGGRTNYFEISYGDSEIKNFIYNTFANQGIWCSRISVSRFRNVLKLKMDLFFSQVLSQKIKLKWTKKYLFQAKKNYKKALKVKNLRNFFTYFKGSKYLVFDKKKIKYFSPLGAKKKLKGSLSYLKVNKAFKFQLESKSKLRNFKLYSLYQEKNSFRERKLISKASVKKIFLPSKIKDIRVKKKKMRKNKYSSLYLSKKKLRSPYFCRIKKSLRVKALSFFFWNKVISSTLQRFLGIENIVLSYSSVQLKYLPTLKFFYKRIMRSLFMFKKKSYFYDSLELIYLIVIIYSKTNAKLLNNIIIYLLENDRKQRYVFRFIIKLFDTMLKKLPSEIISFNGVKLLIKGRFNKRRRSKKVVYQKGSLSISKSDSSLSFDQSKAITIYGAFGIYSWINGKLPFRNSDYKAFNSK